MKKVPQTKVFVLKPGETVQKLIGLSLDPSLNDTTVAIISRKDSPLTVRGMKTNEELMIARHTYNLICEQRGEGKKQNSKV